MNEQSRMISGFVLLKEEQGDTFEKDKEYMDHHDAEAYETDRIGEAAFRLVPDHFQQRVAVGIA